MTDSRAQIGLWKNLLDRRVPQIIGSYLIAGWAMIQFVDWNVNRYLLSPYLTDLALVIILSLIPTVMIVAYYHGKPGPNSWTRVEKVGIPLNLLACGLLLFALFGNKELGAASQVITIENEDGKQVERAIPKAEFRKKLVIFISAHPDKEEDQWLSEAFRQMLMGDLSQDLYLSFAREWGYLSALRNAGFRYGSAVPLTLMNKVATDLNRDFFITTRIRRATPAGLEAEVRIYLAGRARLQAEHRFTAPDLAAATDHLSLLVRRDLGIPERHLEENRDLPVAEIFTASEDAMREFVYGLMAETEELNLVLAAEHYEKATGIDHLFASAYLLLFSAYANNNQTQKSQAALTETMKHLYKLPESEQFLVKAIYYRLNEDRAKEGAVLKMWADLYPFDQSALLELARFYLDTGQLEDVASVYQQMLSIDPRDDEAMRGLGQLYRYRGELDQSLYWYQKVVDLLPENTTALRSVGTIYELKGEYDQALDIYQKIQLLDPGNMYTLLDQGDVFKKRGDLEKAELLFNEVLQKAEQAEHRGEALFRLERLAATRGQVAESVRFMELKWQARSLYQLPLNQQFGIMFDCHHYAIAGTPEKALNRLNNLKMLAPFDKAKALGFARYYAEMRDIKGLEESLVKAEQFAGSMEMLWTRVSILGIRGKLAELQGDYYAAIENYSEYLKLRPQDVSAELDRNRCYLLNGELNKAAAAMQSMLKLRPRDPEVNLLMAKVYQAMGKLQLAAECLQISCAVWQNADSNYAKSREARALLKQAQSTDQEPV